MYKYLSVLLFFTVLCLFACNSSEKKQEEQITAPVEAQFESIPQSTIMKVWNEADLLDYIFHNLPFSMSQDQQVSIRANVSYVSPEVQPIIPEGCKPFARQFYSSKGVIFLEADIYFDETCRFYVFYIDGKPAYANKMTEEGVQFFTTMVNQALKASEGVQ